MAILVVVALPALFFGGVMSAFNHDNSRGSGIGLLVAAICLLTPIVCIWIPGRRSLLIGYIASVPLLILGCLMLSRPLAGFAMLFPIIVWMFCAGKIWKEKTKKRAKTSAADQQPQIPIL
jgi:hypothetical protein